MRADIQGVDRAFASSHFEVPTVARLEVALDVAGEPLGFLPCRSVVGQVDAAIVLIGARTPNVKEIPWHLKEENVALWRAFLNGPLLQITGFELGDALQLFEIQEDHGPVFPCNQAPLSQFLQGPVGVDNRKA